MGNINNQNTWNKRWVPSVRNLLDIVNWLANHFQLEETGTATFIGKLLLCLNCWSWLFLSCLTKPNICYLIPWVWMNGWISSYYLILENLTSSDKGYCCNINIKQMAVGSFSHIIFYQDGGFINNQVQLLNLNPLDLKYCSPITS